MRIEIEIPKEFECDYNKDRFDEFFCRVLSDISDGTTCGRYERETAEMLQKAFVKSKVAYDVEAKVAELEKHMEASKKEYEKHIYIGALGEMRAYEKAISIVRGKDKCSTCQYSSGHVSTCMLKSSVCYHERRIVRGKE